MEKVDRDMSEAELKREVLELAEKYGWLVHHNTHNRRSFASAKGKGVPDLTCARDGVILFAELKREMAGLEPDQMKWRAAIVGRGTGRVDGLVRYHIWRPSHLRLGVVESALALPTV